LTLRGFGLAEVREQLSTTAAQAAANARTVLDVTGGNPLFVREIARAIADGTWRPDRPPRTVLEVVGARLDRVAHADRFFAEKLGPALAKVLGPEPAGAPEVVGIDVVRSYVRQPVA
jgi:hypothetical protein